MSPLKKESAMNIALATYELITETDEDLKLAAFLSDKGIHTALEVWNDRRVDWKQYDAVIIKSTWDYHEKLTDFHEWIDQLTRDHVTVINPPNAIKSNSDKQYLLKIQAQGFPVVPSRLLSKEMDFDLLQYFDTFQTDELVVKPCVSLGAQNVFKLSKKEVNALQTKLKDLLVVGNYLIQPLIEEMKTEGEWSLIFFNGAYSHSVLKKPLQGDFISNHGSRSLAEPKVAYIDVAKLFVERFASDCLYVRVDGVVAEGNFLLMELELIEPYLYLSYVPDGEAYARYYDALCTYMRGK
jgi:glutathione synthase/RimK-type ligase-like ATP-grasp enzyme